MMRTMSSMCAVLHHLCLFNQRYHAIFTDCNVNDLELLHHCEIAVLSLPIASDFGFSMRSLNLFQSVANIGMDTG